METGDFNIAGQSETAWHETVASSYIFVTDVRPSSDVELSTHWIEMKRLKKPKCQSNADGVSEISSNFREHWHIQMLHVNMCL